MSRECELELKNKKEQEKVLENEVRELEEKVKIEFLESDNGKDVLYQIYSYALGQIEQLHQRKRHIETKALYLLQGQMIVVTIYLAINWGTDNNDINTIILKGVALLILIISMVFTVIVQKDNILSYKFVKRKLKKKYHIEVKKEEFEDMPQVNSMLNSIKSKRCSRNFFEQMIGKIQISIDSIDNINIAKNYYLNLSIDIFIISIICIGLLKIFI